MGHNNKWSQVDFEKCEPFVCDSINGICRAIKVCPKDLLIQEEPGDFPMLISQVSCVGCGFCVVPAHFEQFILKGDYESNCIEYSFRMFLSLICNNISF